MRKNNMNEKWVTHDLRDEAESLAAQIGEILKNAIEGLDHRVAL
jgi:hypothetical protein